MSCSVLITAEWTGVCNPRFAFRVDVCCVRFVDSIRLFLVPQAIVPVSHERVNLRPRQVLFVNAANGIHIQFAVLYGLFPRAVVDTRFFPGAVRQVDRMAT